LAIVYVAEAEQGQVQHTSKAFAYGKRSAKNERNKGTKEQGNKEELRI